MTAPSASRNSLVANPANRATWARSCAPRSVKPVGERVHRAVGLERPGKSAALARRAATAAMATATPPAGGPTASEVEGGAGSPPHSPFLREHLLDLAAYTPIEPFHVLAAKLGRDASTIVKLDANENPYGPPPGVREALAGLEFANIYPDPESRRLREALAKQHGVDVDTLLVGAGADELIDFLLRCVLDPGDSIVDCPPTFTMYRFDVAVNAGRVVTVPRKPGTFALDVDGIERAVAEHRPKAVFLTSPNNPDGSVITEADLRRVLALPTLVVLDEAYIEFSDEPSRLSWPGSGEHDNLVVLRTFSKCAALAGMRVGYGAFPRGLARVLWRAKQPYNLTIASEAAACAALEDQPYLARVRDLLVAERARLFDGLASLPWLTPYPSQANFILAAVDPSYSLDGGEIRDRLAKEHGVMIRHYSAKELCGYIRVSVGRPDQTDAVLRALRALPQA